MNNLPIPDIPCVPFHVRSKTLLSMIRHAVDYDEALSVQRKQQNLYQFLRMMINTNSDSTVLFDASGSILVGNSSALKTFGCNTLNGRSIEELSGKSIQELQELPSNALIEINGKNYISNLVKGSLAYENLFALSLTSIKRIENTELSIRTQLVKNGFEARFTFDDILAEDERSVFSKQIAKKYAQFDETILITGETGTGKELFASAIHNASLRRDGPFVAINCAVLSENLIESELFGYEKGSFTGALSSGHKGLFEQAHRGTIFLDEIGEISPTLQSKLLRVLQEKQIRRIGGNEIIPINVRVIAATNRDLRKMCADEMFRHDLYYRLSILDLHLPSLNDRPKDIIPLFKFFLNKYCGEYHFRLFWTDDSIFDELLDYNWPGNIRELENVARRTVILSENICLTKVDLHRGLVQRDLPGVISKPMFQTEMLDSLDALDRAYIQYLLDRFDGKQNRVCEYLHISRSTLWRKLQQDEDGK